MDATQDTVDAAAAAPVARLEFDVDWPPKHVAAYLVEGPRPVLIDAGTSDDGGTAAMRAALADRGLEPADLAAVIVTHPHTDHVGQVPLFREADVPVYAPASVLEQLRRDPEDLFGSVRDVSRSAGLDQRRAEQEAERARESLRRDRDLLDPETTRSFTFEEPFSAAGHEFESIHTPGHQIEHAALLTTLGDERVLFSGDVLIETFRAAALDVGLDRGVYDSIDHFYASMDRLEARDVDRVYPGHGPVFRDVAGAIEATREDLDDLLGATERVVGDLGPVTALDIVHERFGDVQYPAQLLDTLGALGRLERRGAVTVEDRNGVTFFDLP